MTTTQSCLLQSTIKFYVIDIDKHIYFEMQMNEYEKN
jgi:hypothetical protein